MSKILKSLFYIPIVSLALNGCNVLEDKTLTDKERIVDIIESNKFVLAAKNLEEITDTKLRDTLSILLADARNEFKRNRLPILKKMKSSILINGGLYEYKHQYTSYGEIVNVEVTTKYFQTRKRLNLEPYIIFDYDLGISDYKLEFLFRTNVKEYNKFRITCDNKSFEGTLLNYGITGNKEILTSISNSKKSLIWFQPYEEQRELNKSERIACKNILNLYDVLKEMLDAGFLSLDDK